MRVDGIEGRFLREGKLTFIGGSNLGMREAKQTFY